MASFATFRWRSASIRTRLILLVLVGSLVSLAVGYEGLMQAQRGAAGFQNIFENRVVSIGYLKDLEMAYAAQVPRAAGKFADGMLESEAALQQIGNAATVVADVWPKFVGRQRDEVDKLLTEAAEALKADTDAQIVALQDLIKKGDRAAVETFLGDTWYPSADPLTEQLGLLYETLQNESRNDFRDLTAAYSKGRSLQMLIIAVGLAVSLFLGGTVLLTVTRSLSRVQAQLHALAAGEGDLTRRLPTSGDEVGLIAHEVNGLMAKLTGLVRRVQESGIQVTSSFTQLSASSKELEATLNEQIASTNEVVSSAKQISATAQTLVRTMADVSTLSQDAAESAGQGQTGLARMSATMRKMEEASSSIAQKLAAINQKVTNITSVVTTINKVADQTNLLSLNAAIEAAKAGEFGQGFAVVAREIRRLADQTAVATLDIEQMVKDMQSSVSSGVMSMEKFAQEVQGAVQEVNAIGGQIARIIEQVQGLGPRFESVNEGMESQSIGARQISEAMVQLSEATRATAESQRDAARVMQSLDQAARGLHREVSLFKVDNNRPLEPQPPQESAVAVAAL
ncbi:MAG: methyl-accepting chemotaxis protein [Vicinamibacterales bacterium]